MINKMMMLMIITMEDGTRYNDTNDIHTDENSDYNNDEDDNNNDDDKDNDDDNYESQHW